jgi:hypothetical protein
MKLLIELDEKYVKNIDKIKFLLVGGRTDHRKLQLEIIKAIKNGKPLEQEPIIMKISENDKDKLKELVDKAVLTVMPQEPTTKNDLGVDCVARQDVERYIEGFINEYTPKEELEFINLELDGLKHIPSVTPQEPILDKIRARRI